MVRLKGQEGHNETHKMMPICRTCNIWMCQFSYPESAKGVSESRQELTRSIRCLIESIVGLNLLKSAFHSLIIKSYASKFTAKWRVCFYEQATEFSIVWRICT